MSEISIYLETAWNLEIKMMIPYDSTIFYPDKHKDDYIIEPSFQKIMDYLNIKINITEIIEAKQNNPEKSSSIFVFYSDATYNDFIIFDTYFDPTDQINFIYLFIGCTAKKGGLVRQYAHEFYTQQCSYNVIYSEGNREITKKYKIDFSLFDQLNESNYKEAIKNNNIHFYQSGSLLKSIRT